MHRICIFIFLSVLMLSDAMADATAASRSLERIFAASSARIGFSAKDLTTGAPVFSYRADELFTPASILKLATTYVALKDLGPEFRFETELLTSETPSGRSIFVRAGADPNLRTEDLEILARRIRAHAGDELQGLYVDPTAVVSTRERQGQRAYEAGSSALVFNFNSILFQVCPTRPGKPAFVQTDPYEFAVASAGHIQTVSGRGRTYGIDEIGQRRYRLSGSIGSARTCGRHYRSVPDSNRYFMDVLSHRLETMGIAVKETGTKAVPSTARVLYVHRSKALSQILEDLNHFSTNLIAEQIVTAIGRQENGTLSHGRGVDRIEAVARGLGGTDTVLSDASGLSRSNRISPKVLLDLLELADADVRIGVEFEKSLSVLGRNGTLKNRAANDRAVVLRGKTGTLRGVMSLAGYVYAPSGRTIAFVLIQNGADDPGQMQRREQQVIEILNGI